jgi:hypothetical protein
MVALARNLTFLLSPGGGGGWGLSPHVQSTAPICNLSTFTHRRKWTMQSCGCTSCHSDIKVIVDSGTHHEFVLSNAFAFNSSE